jgi:serine/threonine protein kinase/tetratricopeptide (TPR) repeat protein
LGQPFAPAGTATIDDPADVVGTVVAGRYKLLEEIGEGGMGTVWMAEQREPVKRLVAVKLIKPGMDSRAVLARFEAERQALALMDHPNIAKVFDGGTTRGEPGGVSPGRPYFVMELVKGLPVTAYCDDRRLSVGDRLGLFVQICQAVQHAHQKGVIHRDLKPSNVLVTEHDGKPVPKVIDFGLAKALHGPQALTEKTLHTSFGAVVGTPLYMAPEQVGINVLDVDTRTDIYALGVILYELLTGTTPISRLRLGEAAWEEIRRLIQEEEPPRPSLRLSTSDALPSLAAQRQTEPAKLSRLVRGDLDWIVLRALEKDRNRRYDTANGLAMGVQRHLADEPVLACPPSAAYRLRKFVRKHRAGLATAVAFAGLLLLGGLVSAWQAVRAIRAREEAVAARDAAEAERRAAQEQRQRAEEQRQRAEENERQAKAVLEFFQDKVLAAGRPATKDQGGQGLGKDVSLRQAIDAATANLATAFPGQPLVEASIREVLGRTYYFLGEPPLRVQQHERALALRQATLGMKHPDTLASMSNLSEASLTVGKLDRALPLAEEAFKQQKDTLGPKHIETLISMLRLADAYAKAGKVDQALRLAEESFELRKATLGPNHIRTLAAMSHLAAMYRDAGRLDRAVPLAEEVFRLRKALLGPEDYYTLVAMNNLAETYGLAGKLDQALALGEEALELRKAALGPEHADTLRTMSNLARTYDAARRYAEAVRVGRELIVLQRRKLPADDPALAATLSVLGLSLLHAHQPAEAEPLLRECLAVSRKKQADLWMTFHAQSLLGGSLLGQKKYAEAEPLLLEGYEGMKQRADKIPVGAKPHLAEALERLVQLYEAWGKPDEAAKWRAESPTPPAVK